MASVSFQTHLGLFGYLNFAPSYTSSKLLLHQRPASRLEQGKLPGHLSTIGLSAARAATTNSIPEEQQQQTDICSSSSSTSTKGWLDFAENVSGEWDGYGADFSKKGEPIELPESVVPEAFREWEVKVFDWQTQCPTLALPQLHPTPPHFHFSYKLIRLLPTVGCEADAATRHSILERSINTHINTGKAPATVIAFAYQSSGCYVAVWSEQRKDCGGSSSSSRVLELEHCLVDPRDRESRVRIIQEVRVHDGQQQKMQLESIKVFCEQWYGPFNNGDQLGGCAIRDSAFASTPALQSSRISGVWHGFPHAFATFQHKRHSSHSHEDMKINELVVEETSAPRLSSRDGNSQILLPKQLWCSSNHQEDKNRENCFQVGWLLDEGFAITSRCIFSSNANLKEIAVTHEKLQT